MSTADRPRLSAAIIAQNEAHQIPGLLSALSFVDEVVLVDGGSSDATAAQAAALGARVFTRPFDQFASQRNFALQQCRGDWVLSIDADERPTPALAAELVQHAASSTHDAWRVPIRSRIFGSAFRYSGTQDDRPIRFWRRGAAQWQGGVHERLQVSGSIGQLSHFLTHETLPDGAAFQRKMQHYTSLAAEAMVADGQPPHWHAAFYRPAYEVLRRLVWKHGWLDGPAGWRFCLLSGWSEWTLAQKHRQLWQARQRSLEAETPITHYCKVRA